MTTGRNLFERRFGRRGLLRQFGLAGVGAALWQGFGGGRRPARAIGEPTAGPATALLSGEDANALFTTGPLPAIAAPAGARLGVCLLFGGAARGRGRLPLIRGVERAELDQDGVGPFEVDLGVAQGVYRLLDGLHVERPVELYGLSAPVGRGAAGGAAATLTWEAQLRGPAVSPDHLRRYLEGFHACVVGLVADDSRFTGRMSYVEVRSVS